MSNQSGTQQEQELLQAEAKRRVQKALQQIEEAQNLLGAACATLSSLCYARPEWNATSKLHDRVKSHWYKVEGSLRNGAKANKVALDTMNAEDFLQGLRK